MRRLPQLLALLLLVCLGGCQSMSQRVAGWYVTRKIDQYLDLTSAQKADTRTRVDETIETLRRDELAKWISFLREVRQGIHDGLADEQLARLQRHYDARLDRGVELLTPRFAPVLAQLDAKQLDHFAGRMREDVDKLYEDRDKPKDAQREKFEKKALKFVTDFVGDLSDEQEEQVRVLIRRIPDERDKQYESAQDNITHFRTFMGSGPSADAIVQELKSMWSHRYDGLGQGREKDVRRGEQRKWLMDVFALLTPKQRAHAEEKVTERIVEMKKWVLPS